MKSFRFKSISLLSHRDGKAKEVTFNPRKNLITGRNHTGKSSIVKSIFLTFGATPVGDLSKWDPNTISLVRFSIGGLEYSALRWQGKRALFNQNNEILFAATGHRTWSDSLNTYLGFNLILTDKKLEPVTADVRAFFLPFYINQDGSWNSTWTTFSSLQQYSAPYQAILEYFTGVKPPRYYELNSSRQIEQKHLIEKQRELEFLERARLRFSETTSLNDVKLSSENFEQEIEQLTIEVNLLNKKQEILREKLVKQQEVIATIDLQIDLASEALGTFNKDKNYLIEHPKEALICPVCNAHHDQTFMPVLTYFEDARLLHDLQLTLNEDSSKAKGIYAESRKELSKLESDYIRIKSILELRRDGLRFGDVINQMGAESAFQAFITEERAIRSEIDAIVSRIAVIEVELKSLLDKKKSKEIVAKFRSAYTIALSKLNMPQIDGQKVRLSSRPSLSGSGGPRSILAYYSAIWQVCLSEYGSFNIPIVVDSPNQQGQDSENLPKVLNYVANELPENAQTILSTESFDNSGFDNHIHFVEPYSVLEEEQYNTIKTQLEPLVNAMNLQISLNDEQK